MKKIAFALIAAGLGLSSSVFAAGKELPDNGQVTTDAAAGCELLTENIKVNLSSNVKAGFNCNVATNTITVGTCHTAGSRNPTLTCAVIGQNADGEDVFNDDECTETGTVIEGSGPDFRGFFGQTSGGSVGAAFLLGSCTAAQVAAHPKMGD